MDLISVGLNASWALFSGMSAYILLGLLIVGVLHVVVPPSIVRKYAGNGRATGPLWAALFGVPLPLCSCGVLPFAAGLRRAGAGRGATLSFLISTPQTGVDSALVVWNFFGLPFALFKIFAAFISGVLGGWLGFLLLDKREAAMLEPRSQESCCSGRKKADVAEGESPDSRPSFKSRLKQNVIAIFHYGYVAILGDIAFWLIVGCFVAGFVSALLPSGSLSDKVSPQWLFYPLVLAFSVPLYVCSIASVPLAAVMVAGGMPPGAAIVFLMAGPATNMATIGVVAKVLGKGALFIYMSVIVVGSVLAGIFFDGLMAGGRISTVCPQCAGDDQALSLICGIILAGLSVFVLARKVIKKETKAVSV
jgi:hypothetical protein